MQINGTLSVKRTDASGENPWYPNTAATVLQVQSSAGTWEISVNGSQFAYRFGSDSWTKI